MLDIHGLCLLKAVAVQAICKTPPALSPHCLECFPSSPNLPVGSYGRTLEQVTGKGLMLLQHFVWAENAGTSGHY